MSSPQESQNSGITLAKDVVRACTLETPLSAGTAVEFRDDDCVTFMGHLFHFVEFWITAIHALDLYQIDTQSVTLLLFPSQSDDSWRGNFHDHNLHLLHALFPNLHDILDGRHIDKGQHRIQIDRLITLNRAGMPHRGINKMCASIFPVMCRPKLQAAIESVYKHLGVLPPSVRRFPLTVTYIGRKKGRRWLPARFEARLENEFAALSRVIRFRKVYFEDYSFADQVGIAATTDVMIGVHGNGLTHALFMPERGLLIEIFPAGTFHYDYFSIAWLRDHRYAAFEAAKPLAWSKMFPHGSTFQPVRRIDPRAIAAVVQAHLPFLASD